MNLPNLIPEPINFLRADPPRRFTRSGVSSRGARVKGAVDKLEGIVPIHCRKKTEFHDRLIIDLI